MTNPFIFKLLSTISLTRKSLFPVLGLLLLSPLTAQLSVTAPAATLATLEAFAADYEHDAHFTRDWTFGVQVDDLKYTIHAQAATERTPGRVQVESGFPTTPTFYFKTTEWALADIAKGEMNALTGAVKAFSTDYAPFDLEVMDGYQPAENFVAEVLPLMFHFWTKGTPEIIPFGPRYARNTHGAQASIFYYQPGLRSGYGILFPGQHANEHPSSQSNEFPTLFILVEGTVTAKLNGVEHEVSAGNAIFIPPGMTHEFRNDRDEAAEFILLMFGEGA